MSETSFSGATEPEAPPEEGREPAQNGIDLQALAEKLYRLLKEEARLERERLGRNQTR